MSTFAMRDSSEPTFRNKRLAILGTGMMGGSVGKAALAKGIIDRVTGFDLQPQRLGAALRSEAITHQASSASDAVRGASLVVIATPVEQVAQVFGEITSNLGKDTLVTDLGSTKSRIVAEIDNSQRFLGSHPLAGSEEEGVGAASADMFEGCVWLITPTRETRKETYRQLAEFVTSLGATPLALDPDRHDELVALTSHLPQIVASALMSVAAQEDWLPKLAAGGFRDTTRLAGSSADLWVGIVEQNREQILKVLDRFRSQLGRWRELIDESRWDDLRSELSHARESRSKIPSKPGRAALIELAIPIPDRPGVLGHLTTALGEAGVNIEDMQIEHSSAGGRGKVRLLIEGEEAARAAEAALAGQDFEVNRVS